MAKPRILISSTCADLYLLREQLRGLINDFGYEPVLSEDGDIYYSPDLHVHLACIREIRNCDLVVLLVGNRFGSSFVEAPAHSVTQAEHDAAYLSSLPIFAFVDEKVLHDHAIYRNVVDKHRENQAEQDRLLSSIPFASKTDLRVFRFIDDIARKVVNNAYFPFRNFQDIEIVLKKQWAGMLFDFLSERKQRNSNQNIISLLSQIEIANDKVERIVGLLASKTIPPADQENLKSIEFVANEKRLNLVLLQIWQSFDLNAEALENAKDLKKGDVALLRELLLDRENNDKLIITLTETLQKLCLAKPKSYYVHYLIDIRLNELREICKRYEITPEMAEHAIRETLLLLPAAPPKKKRKK